MSDRDDFPGPDAPEDDEDAAQAAFLARLTPPLRARETLDPGFEARVMELARAEAPRLYPKERRAWWRRPRTVRLSPLGALALAAGFAGIVSISTLAAVGALGGGGQRDMPNAPVVETVHLVRFVLDAPGARSVTLVGDFNAWAKEATPLRAATVPGVWTVSVPLMAGRHEYAFIIDGERWVVDPLAAVVTDDFGTESSVVTVGNGASAM
jgi:hypothetical protein